MSQFDFGTIDPYVVDGVQLADMLNQWRDAIHSMHRAGTRPTYVVPGMMWIDDSAGPTSWVVNVYFSPTVGDMPLFTYDTTTGNISVSASTGGTFAAAVLLAQAAAAPMVRWNATGNPIDQKDWRAIVTTPAGALRFSAYSDAGVEQQWVQFNRDGTTSSSLSRLQWQLYNEQILAAPATSITVTVPSGCKAFEILFEIQSTGGSNDVLLLQAMQGGTVYTTANQNSQSVLGAGATAAAAQALSAGYFALQPAVTGWSGSMKGSLAPGSRSDMIMSGSVGMTQPGGGHIATSQEADGGPPRNTVTGFRLSSQLAINFVIGSFARILVLA
jgi:hypothetical protein